jgi:sialic acid synthase SpsE
MAMRRYLVAAKDLPAGHRIMAGDIILKKVAFGLSPAYFDLIVGSITREPLTADDRFTLDSLVFHPEAGIV